MAIVGPLYFVRDLNKFAFTHIFIDIVVFISLLTICGMATKDAYQNGFKTNCIEPVGNYWASGIGASIFTFEGIGVILPIKDVIKKKEDYTKVVCVSVGFYCFCCIAYGEYSLFGFGAEKSMLPLVTESMPRKNPLTWTIKILYCVVVTITCPLQIFPAMQVIDSYTSAGL